MTWKEFKDVVEADGVRDDDAIWYIDVTFPVEVTTSREAGLGVAIGD